MKPKDFPHFLADFSHPFFLPGIYISAARSRPDNPIITSAPQPLSPGSIDLLHSPVLADLVLFALLRVYAKLMGSTLYSQVGGSALNVRKTRGAYHPLRSLVYWQANAAPVLPHCSVPLRHLPDPSCRLPPSHAGDALRDQLVWYREAPVLVWYLLCNTLLPLILPSLPPSHAGDALCGRV